MKSLLYSELFAPIPGGVQPIVLELAPGGLARWSSRHPVETPIDATVMTRPTEAAPGDASLPAEIYFVGRNRRLMYEIS
jgi:hypothetical protein